MLYVECIKYIWSYISFHFKPTSITHVFCFLDQNVLCSLLLERNNNKKQENASYQLQLRICCPKTCYVVGFKLSISFAEIKNCYNLVGLRLFHTAMANFFKHFHKVLPSQCEHINWSPRYPFLPLMLPSWMGIEPIHDGNGNDTKIMKIMPLPSQCEQALTFLSYSGGSDNEKD